MLDHSTLSRTCRLIDLETHEQVFAWVLHLLADRELLQGKRIGIKAATLEANAAMRSVVRRDTGDNTTSFSPDWSRHRAWKLQQAKIWYAWTASARSAL